MWVDVGQTEMAMRAIIPAGAAFSILLFLAPSARAAWQEMHETSDDVRLEIGPDGVATVAHRLRIRVVAGHFKTLELAGIDARAQVAPQALVTAEKGGAELPARVEADPKLP